MNRGQSPYENQLEHQGRRRRIFGYMKAHSYPIKATPASFAKAKLRPQLITGTSSPNIKKKTESDLDYNPDNDEDTQDTEEDVRLEKTAVPEQKTQG